MEYDVLLWAAGNTFYAPLRFLNRVSILTATILYLLLMQEENNFTVLSKIFLIRLPFCHA